MKILCIEDNQEKYDNIYKQIKSIVPELTIEWVENGNDGLRRLYSENYDLLILDMSLPINSFSEAKVMLYGESILNEIKRSKKNIKVIVVTGFDQFEYKNERLTFTELDDRLKKRYGNYLLEMIYYDQLSVEWSNTLRERIQHLAV